MTPHTPDDGFHEIQLNGKQLVFLFMAATVVSVVIFLCGVLVGRGVRAERGVADEAAALADSPVADSAIVPPPTASVDSDPRVASPPPAVEELSYFNRLEKSQPTTEELKPLAPAAERPQPEPKIQRPAETRLPDTKTVEAKAAEARVAEAKAPNVRPADTRPVGASTPVADRGAQGGSPPSAAKPGFAVQLAALNSRSEADAMAKRLSARGYEAYVLAPAGGAPSIFRVRIGNYDTRSEAENVAAKLEKEGQFKPWVTR